jgi:glycosyltransferase involved in cell wall biosynthesis
MHVGLNLLFLLPGVVGGTETYAVALVRHLAELDRENRYTLFINAESADARWVDQENFDTVVCGVRARSRAWRYAYEQLGLPRLARSHGIEVLHSLGYVGPLRPGCSSVVTVHDLNYEAIPEAFTPLRRQVLRFLVPRSARQADAVLTLSDASRCQIVERIGISAEKVTVTHCGAEHGVSDAGGNASSVLSARAIDRPYILALSSGSPHKNLGRLLRAFALLKRDDVQLVLVGHEPTRGESLRTLADELGIGRSVVFTGYLSDEALALVRRNAMIFAFPSLYEGFGIPVLEAMQAGVPVVSSDAASLPEVVGDAGRLVDTRSVPAIASALRELLDDPAARAELIERGRRQVLRFSWHETARRTLEVYRAVHAVRAGRERAVPVERVAR